MSGASINQSRVVSNLFTDVGFILEGKKCTPYGSVFRIHILRNTLYTYPDLSIFCDDIERAETNFDTAVNPTVLVEVLSP